MLNWIVQPVGSATVAASCSPYVSCPTLSPCRTLSPCLPNCTTLCFLKGKYFCVPGGYC